MARQMISVCMATYNGAEFLTEQIDSILPQLGKHDELVISDDGSTDSTITVLNSYNDDRILIVKNKFAKGYASNFENALEHSTGDYIFLCDQDDIWCSDKIKTCMEVLKTHDFVVHDAKVVNSIQQVIAESYFRKNNVKKGFLSNFYKIGYLGCCMAFKRSVFLKSKPFPLKERYITHDSWLTLIAEYYFKTALIDKPLISYRRHSTNTSQGGMSEGNSLLTKFNIRIYSFYKLMCS